MNLAQRNAAIVKAEKLRAQTFDAIAEQIAHRAGVRRGRDVLSGGEKKWIVELYERGMPMAHIGGCVRRSKNAVFKYLVRIGRHTPTRKSKVWVEAEDAVLRAKYGTARGMVRVIAKELGRTRNEVIGRAFRLGLGRKVGA